MLTTTRKLVDFGLRQNIRSFSAGTTRFSRLILQRQSAIRRSAHSTVFHWRSVTKPNNLQQQVLARIRDIRGRHRWYSDSTNPPKPHPTPHLGSPEPAPSLSQRLKNLSREYGWSALGVYLALSAIDFPFCFLAVRLLGTERIGKWEHEIIEGFSNLVRMAYPSFRSGKGVVEATVDVDPTIREGIVDADNTKSGETAGLGTQLVLAYAVHKSLIFFRVPLTAAVLPKVVKTLRGWGWNIGKKPLKNSKPTSWAQE